MELNKQLELISELINSTEDKETIGKLGSLADSLKEQDNAFKKQEDEYLESIAKWRDAYKDSILKGGFKSNESAQEAEPVKQPQVLSFDELLSKYANK